MTLVAPPASWVQLNERHAEFADLLQRLWRLATGDEQHYLLERLGDLIIAEANKQTNYVLDTAIDDVHAAIGDLRDAARQLERMRK